MAENLPAKLEPNTPAVQGDKAQAVLQFVEAEREVYRYFLSLAKGLSDTNMLPKGQNAQQAANVMLYGHQIHGWPAMKSLKNLTCISNRVGMYAEAMVGLVREAGIGTFEYTIVNDPPCVTIRGTRTDTGETFEDTWDVARAAREGLTNPLYKTKTLTMLRHRCESEVCRTLFNEALAGVYCPEELHSFGASAPEDDTRSRTETLLLELGGAGAEDAPVTPAQGGTPTEASDGSPPDLAAPAAPPAAPGSPESDKAPEAYPCPHGAATDAPGGPGGADGPTDYAESREIDAEQVRQAFRPKLDDDPVEADRELRLGQLRALKKSKPEAFKTALFDADVKESALGKCDPAMLGELVGKIKGGK